MIRRHVWAALASLTVVACASAAVPPVAHAASLDFKVTNYDNDNTTGVYLRTSSNVNAKTSTLLTYGTGIHLDCELSGSAVGPNNNTIWDHVTVTTGSAKGKTGYLSDHWINTPVGGASGEPKCSSGTSVGSKAIAWARGHLGQSYMSGLCLGFAMRAYSSAGVDIGGASSAAAYWTNNPRNYTRHTNTSPAVGALVFWGATSSNSAGHVGIYEGNDTVISTSSWPSTGTAVHEFSFSGRNRAGYPYLGWMSPA